MSAMACFRQSTADVTLSDMNYEPYEKGFKCFVGKGTIAPNDKHGWTVLIEPRLITLDESVKSPQFIWAYDRCVIKLIPLAAYPYPDIEKRVSTDDV